MSKLRYTTYFIKEELSKRFGVTLVNEWEGSQVKLKILCKCGEYFYKTWDDINSTNTGICKSCSLKLRLQKKQIKKSNEVREFFSSRGWVLENDYEDLKTILTVTKSEVTKTGKFNLLKYLDIFHDEDKDDIKYKNKKFENAVKFLNNYNIKILSEKDIKMSFDVELKSKCHCGELFTMKLNYFKSKKHKGCTKCSPRKTLTEKEIKKLIEERGFVFHNVTEGKERKVTFSNDLGTILTRKLKDILYENINNKTYMKVKSRGEFYIEEYLNDKGIKFETEKTFPDLKSNKYGSPRFDFYLPDHNTIIEFHGSQHFEPHWDFVKGINVFINLANTMESDKFKCN